MRAVVSPGARSFRLLGCSCPFWCSTKLHDFFTGPMQSPQKAPLESSTLPHRKSDLTALGNGTSGGCNLGVANGESSSTNALSLDQFLGLVRKAGLIDEQGLNEYLSELRGTESLPQEASAQAAVLVHDGLLTRFQTKQLLKGRSRGFLVAGKYKILEELGAGGMGRVYLCEHVRLQRLIALKVLAQQESPAALERFNREARVVAALDHPNIVRLFDIDQDGRVHFMVMEFIDGINLQLLVGNRGRLAPERAAHYVAQAALGLQHAHEAALVHRDIKPANLLLDRNGVIKILDLGLARFFDGRSDQLTEQFSERAILG